METIRPQSPNENRLLKNVTHNNKESRTQSLLNYTLLCTNTIRQNIYVELHTFTFIVNYYL